MPLAYQRAQEEWPWIGNISYWFFKRPSDYEKNQAFYYFRMVEPDFTPLPVYDSMKQYITSQKPVLYAGVHQAESWAITKPTDAKLVDADGAEFGKAIETPNLSFTAYGTDVILRLKGNNFVVSGSSQANLLIIKPSDYETYDKACKEALIICAQEKNFTFINDGWNEVIIAHSLIPITYNVSQ